MSPAPDEQLPVIDGRITRKPDRTVELALRTPIDANAGRIEVLTFRPIKAKHMRTLPADPNLGNLLDIAGFSTGLSAREIDLIDAADVADVLTIVGEFLAPGRPIGPSA